LQVLSGDQGGSGASIMMRTDLVEFTAVLSNA
jgi:hypothetical protein